MIAKTQVTKNGEIVVPAAIAQKARLSPGSEVLIVQRGRQIQLLTKQELKSLLDNARQEFIKAVQKTGGFKGNTPFLFGLNADEYFALSEHEQKSLWNETYQKESEKLNAKPEVEFTSNFNSAG